MDFDAVLHYTVYIAFLVGMPLAAGVCYFCLLLHQAIKNEERFIELKKRKGRRAMRLTKLEEARRLADPFFHFNIGKSRTVDMVVQEKLAREHSNASGPTENGKSMMELRDRKILRAIEQGKLILMETSIADCAPGMVVGRQIPELDIARGAELTNESIMALRSAGIASVPILYNPNRVSSAIAASA